MAKRFELAKKYTEKYKSVLLPCRFCGNTDIKIVSDRTIFPKPRDVWSVVCTTPYCDSSNYHSCVKGAVEAWNKQQCTNKTEQGG